MDGLDTEKVKGETVLAQFIDQRKALRGVRGQGKFKASLRKDGTINFDGIIYSSPSAAARAALGQKRHGWTFWSYRDTDGNWVHLDILRKAGDG